jgi:hypothetical protein
MGKSKNASRSTGKVNGHMTVPLLKLQVLSQVSEISKLKEQLRQANAKLEKRRRGTCLPVVMPPRRPS